SGGRELGLRRETLELLAAPAIPPARGFYDECMKGDGIQFSLGFMKSTAALRFGSASSFGSPGAGGTLGFADPAMGLGYAYVTSQMGTRLAGDPRDVALREALDFAISASSGAPPIAAEENAGRGLTRGQSPGAHLEGQQHQSSHDERRWLEEAHDKPRSNRPGMPTRVSRYQSGPHL